MTGKRCWHKLLQLLFSWKFQLLGVSTWLFYKGILSESGWLIMASGTTGLRELVNLVSMKLGVASPTDVLAEPAPGKKGGKV